MLLGKAPCGEGSVATTDSSAAGPPPDRPASSRPAQSARDSVSISYDCAGADHLYLGLFSAPIARPRVMDPAKQPRSRPIIMKWHKHRRSFARNTKCRTNEAGPPSRLNIEIYREFLIRSGPIAHKVDQAEICSPLSRFCRSALEVPAILTDTGWKASSLQNRLTARLVSASSLHSVQFNRNGHVLTDLAFTAFNLKRNIRRRQTATPEKRTQANVQPDYSQ
jgi:hypothetical protein